MRNQESGELWTAYCSLRFDGVYRRSFGALEHAKQRDRGKAWYYQRKVTLIFAKNDQHSKDGSYSRF